MPLPLPMLMPLPLPLLLPPPPPLLPLPLPQPQPPHAVLEILPHGDRQALLAEALEQVEVGGPVGSLIS